MAEPRDPADATTVAAHARVLAAAGRFLDAHGWAPATAGNYSIRLDAARAAVTVSGRHKGRLTEDDALVVDMAGRPTPWPAGNAAKRPSAETLLHTQLLGDYPAIGAVLHTHSVAATVLSMADPARRAIDFAGYELLKVFDGYDTHDAVATVPIFDNSQDMAALAEEVRAYFRRFPPMGHMPGKPGAPGYLIRGHGVYTWGADMDAALRHAEGLEFLFACEWERARLGR